MLDDSIDIDGEVKLDFNGSQNLAEELNSKQYYTSNNSYLREFDFASPAAKLNKAMVVEEISKYTYPAQLTDSFERENYTISTDHCYARPWNWRPDGNFLRPTKVMFGPKQKLPKTRSSNPLVQVNNTDDEIDVDSIPQSQTSAHDWSKAKNLMVECEKYAFTSRTDKGDDDWEDNISKINWSPAQHRVFNGLVNILNSFNLGKLSYTDNDNEPILRRTVIDKAVQRIRRLLATVAWEPKITQWLHQLLIDNLGPHYLANYLDILQTLKAKLPNFVEKMMYGPNSTLRMGALNNVNLQPLLERVWDPLPNLNQEKPKKLPGNPILVIVPSAPISSSNSMQKWVKLLSNLTTVVTVPTNFGSAGHRMTMTNCLDQLFSVTRGTIQDVRADHPGRNIVLVGFRAGAALALQVARVEPVLSVIAVSFSLLTAEGRRGEPDDSLMELQCPVLFIIGQRSNVSSQEDMEDLRERMRVETGLIIIGSADDYLRISKKKKRTGVLTQGIVDRCVVDEIGEFISGIILSPYPPQIRQSPTQVIPEATFKKGKLERKRYNSNASSLDSEPPSPTPPRITRPVGRPPGSKSKTRLETKWAQQIAQGNNNSSQPPPSPNPSPTPPYPTITTPDTSSTDSSSQPDKQSVQQQVPDSPVPTKKLKTLKPYSHNMLHDKPGLVIHGKNNQARLQAYGLSRSVVQEGNLSTLLQGGIKTIPPNPKVSNSSGIKILENVPLTANSASKLIQNRGIDLSKITLLNSVKSNSTSNVILLPDGKFRTIKTTTGSPIMVPMSPQKGLQKQNRNKFITAKRQLVGQKPPRPMKKTLPYIPNSTVQTNLPPPTNLTTQDIMDLPIIFADDNQILETTNVPAETPSVVSKVSTPSTPQVTKVITSMPPTKFMLVNKQAGQGNIILNNSNVRKSSPITFSKPSPKFTKIILSTKKSTPEEKSNSRLQCFSPEITIKKVTTPKQPATTAETPPVELVDLENEIKATAVPKPNMPLDKNITLVQKNASGAYELVQMKQEPSSSVATKKILNFKYDILQKRPQSEQMKSILTASKRPLSGAEMTERDLDYIPPKSIKLE